MNSITALEAFIKQAYPGCEFDEGLAQFHTWQKHAIEDVLKEGCPVDSYDVQTRLRARILHAFKTKVHDDTMNEFLKSTSLEGKEI